ncbi:MAG: hypothetical protein GF364_16385 [Candidatus Lokiarchaeota archaeon]|nr:hypothetical protein [Candidatus Lokiarchaeota archaeon]
MASKSKENLDVESIKKYQKYDIKCPICKKQVKVGVELGDIKAVEHFPFTHIFLHGDPIHALVVYIDKQFNVRGFEGCNSMSLQKESSVFQQILRKWSNPF